MTKLDMRKINPQALEKLRLTVIDLFSEGVFHQIGMREIAKRANVGLATIYKYFGSKDELVFASIAPDMRLLADQLQAVIADNKGDTNAELLKSCLLTHVSFYLKNRQIAEIVYLNIPTKMWVDQTLPEQVEQVELMREILIQGQHNNEIRKDIAIDILLQLTLGALFRYLVALFAGHLEEVADKENSTDITNQLFSAIWPMLKKAD